MAEALAAEIDDLGVQVGALQSKDVTHDSFIADNTSALGINAGEDNINITEASATPFLGGSTDVKSLITALGTNIGSVYSNIGGLLGLGQFDTDFGTGFVILPNGEDAKSLFQAVELELQSLSAGAGATWSAGIVQSVETSNIADLSDPDTDIFGGETLSQGDVFLASGQTAQSENGFYVFDTASTALVRWADADADEDFIQNRSVQIVSDGTEWAYKGIADPTVDTNVLPFEKIRESIIADQAISEAKLTTTLADKLNDKVNKYTESGISLVSDGNVGFEYTVNHNLGTPVPSVTIFKDGSRTDYDIDIVDSNSFTISTSQADSNISIAVM